MLPPILTPSRSTPIKAIALLRNVGRARAIFTVLVKNGFLEFLQRVSVPSYLLSRIISHTANKYTLWQRIRITCEELGPTFVKLAQIASTRDDLLPAPLILELKMLRSQVTPVPWESIANTLATEIRGGVIGNFSEFDQKPVASGSIGQIYKARLKNSGTLVAVKVQRPGIRRAMRADMEIIAWLAQRAHEQFLDLRPYSLPTIVAETSAGIFQELDFTIEAKNTAHFNTINPFDDIFAPKIFEKLCTPRLLVSEWIDGNHPGSGVIPKNTAAKLAKAGANSVFQQIFIDGFFHADPHSGNLLVTNDNRLCFIDWGLAGAITRRSRYMLADLFRAVSSQNPEKVLQALLINGVNKKIDRNALEVQVGQVLRKHSDLANSPGKFGSAMLDLLRIFSHHEIPLVRDYTLLAKAVLAIEASGRALDPEFDLREHTEKFLKKLLAERWNPRTLVKLGYWELASNIAQLRELPSTLSRIFQKIENGNATVTVEHTGLDTFRRTVEISVNRLVFAIIVAALLIGSSMLIRGDGNSFEFPKSIGVIGYALAFFFTIYLIWDIIRHGRIHKNADE